MGEGLALASAVAWALTTVIVRPIGARGLLASSMVRQGTASLILLAVSLPTGTALRLLTVDAGTLAWLLVSVLCSLVIGDTAFFFASNRIGVARALPIAASYPLVTTFASVVILGDPLRLGVVLGAIMVVLGVAAIASEKAARTAVAPDRSGYWLAAGASILWGTNGILLAHVLTTTDALVVNTLRFPMSTGVFAVYLLSNRSRFQLRRPQVALSALAGLGQVTSAVLFVAGISLAGVARAVTLNATSPIFAAILGVTLLRERASVNLAVGALLTVGGCVLLVST